MLDYAESRNPGKQLKFGSCFLLDTRPCNVMYNVNNGFFDAESNVAAKWVSATIDKTNAKTVLDSIKKISEQTSNNKLISAWKSAIVEIGRLGRTALEAIPCENIEY